MSLFRLIPAALAVAALACDGTTTPPDPTPQLSLGGSPSIANGGGHYLFAGTFNLQFSLSAIQHAGGDVCAGIGGCQLGTAQPSAAAQAEQENPGPCAPFVRR